MLFHSTLRKELARSFGATLVVLVTIVMTMTLIRTLGLASRGSVNPQEVMMVMGYTVLGYLPTILTCPVHRHRRHALAHVPRQRDGDLVLRRPRPVGASCGRCSASPGRSCW
jgi:hypothetical protein